MNGHFLKVGLAPVFMMLTSCMVGPDFIKPKAPAVDRYTQ